MAKKKRTRKGPISGKEQKKATQLSNNMAMEDFKRVNLIAAYREKIKRMNDGK